MPLGRSRRFASLRAFLAGTGTELIHIMRRFETLPCACSRSVAVAAWASAIPARPVSSPLWVGEGRQCEQLGRWCAAPVCGVVLTKFHFSHIVSARKAR